MNWPEGGAEYALLLNNVGTTSNLEMGCLLHSAVACCQQKDVKVARVYSGTFMTATDMAGFSLSLLRLQQPWKEYLDKEAKVNFSSESKSQSVNCKLQLVALDDDGGGSNLGLLEPSIHVPNFLH